MSFGLHCLANGLVWLCMGASRDPQQAQLLQELLRLPKVHTVSHSSCSCLSGTCAQSVFMCPASPRRMLQAQPLCSAHAKEVPVSAETSLLLSTQACSNITAGFSADNGVITLSELQLLALQVEQWRANNGPGVWIEHAGLQAVVRHILESAAARLGGN